MTIDHSTLIENSSGQAGGAVANAAEMSIIASLLSNNSTFSAGGAVVNSGTLSIIESSVSDNSAGFLGAPRGRVHFEEYTQQIGNALAGADVMALPSDFEGDPLIVHEARG